MMESTINKNNYYQLNACKICYIGYDFSVRLLHEWLPFRDCIKSKSNNGLYHCEFTPHRQLTGMKLVESKKMRDKDNAGGSSEVSEYLSLELFAKCYKANLEKTEMEVEYFPRGGMMTDYVCTVFGTKIGVSVTRAHSYSNISSLNDAENLLKKKLKGIDQSNRNSLEKWHKQVLHIWSAGDDISNKLEQAFHNLEPEKISNTVVLITTTTTACDFIFRNEHTRSPNVIKSITCCQGTWSHRVEESTIATQEKTSESSASLIYSFSTSGISFAIFAKNDNIIISSVNSFTIHIF